MDQIARSMDDPPLDQALLDVESTTMRPSMLARAPASSSASGSPSVLRHVAMTASTLSLRQTKAGVSQKEFDRSEVVSSSMVVPLIRGSSRG